MEQCTTQQELEKRTKAACASLEKAPGVSGSMALELASCSLEEYSLELCHEVNDWDMNIQGSMHGGQICLLMDTTMGILCRCLTGDSAATTIDLHVNFLRLVPLGKPLHTKARISRLGRKVISINAEAWTDDANRLCATACATFFRPTRHTEKES